MSVRPEDAVRRLRTRLERNLPADRAAEQRARAALSAIKSGLEQAGVSRAFLFGSLAAGTFHVGSDVDIAVDGVSPWRIASLQDDLRDATGERVDLIPLGAARPTLREHILRVGVQLL